MKRPTQPKLFRAPRRTAPAPARETSGIAPFEFVPGPECTPRPGFVVPDELRLPTDEPEWMPEVRTK